VRQRDRRVEGRLLFGSRSAAATIRGRQIKIGVLSVTWLLALWSGTSACTTPSLRPASVRGAASAGGDALLAPQVVPFNTILSAAAVSPDRQLIALGDKSGFVLILSAAQQRLISRLPVHVAAVSALRFRNGSGVLLSVGADGRVCVTDVPRSNIERCMAADGDSFDYAAFSPDATLVAGASTFRSGLAIWSLDGGSALYTERAYGGQLAISPDGKHVATSGGELCSLAVTRSCLSLDDQLKARVSAVAFDLDNNVILAADDGLTWFSLTTRRPHTRAAEAASRGRLPEVTANWTDALSLGLSYLARKQGQYFDAIVALSDGRAIGITGNHGAFLVSDFGGELKELGFADVAAATGDGRWAVTAAAPDGRLETTVWNASEDTPTRAVVFSIDARSPSLVRAISNRLALIAAGDHLWAIDWPTMTVVPVLRVKGTLAALSVNGDLAIESEPFQTTVIDTHSGTALSTIKSDPIDDRPPLVVTRGETSAMLARYAELRDPTTGKTLVSFPEPRYPWKLPRSDFRGNEWVYATDTLTISSDGRRIARRLDNYLWEQPRTALQVLDAGGGIEIGRILFWGDLGAVSMTADGRRLLVAARDEPDGLERWTLLGGDTPGESKLRLFDVDNGNELFQLATPRAIGALAFSPDGAWAYVGGADRPSPIRRLDLVHRRWMDRDLAGHLQTVRDMAVTPDGKHLVSISDDGTARVWNVATGASVALVFLADDWLAYTDDGYFDSSRRGERLASAFSKGKMFPLEQFAVRGNRPDRLIERLVASAEGRFDANANDVIGYFHDLYLARLRRLELREDQLGRAFDVPPTATIAEARCDGNHAEIVLELTTGLGVLTSYDLYANGVQLFEPGGRKVTGTRAHVRERIELSAGINRVEVTARSNYGIESLRDTRDISCPASYSNRLYYLGFGVAKYKQPMIAGVKFADDDARALEQLFKRAGAHTKVLTNEEVTRDAIRSARDFLRDATVEDTVVILIAGHGVHLHERGGEYAFLTYPADPARLRDTAAPIGMFEELFAEIRPRERLLLIDSCESGEDPTMPPTALERITIPSSAAARSAHDRYIYNDITRRTGTVVFSAARGYERSSIDEQAGHGFFTAAILDALHGAADIDHDGRVSLEELRAHVSTAVQEHNPAQHPTIDRENRSANFTLPVVAPR
jgi:WD40 repeat protein